MNKYQAVNENGNVQCLLCPRQCELAEGKRGFCHIRQNIGGEVQLTSNGYTTGLAVDPIEKKPLYHFYPGSSILSFGTLGCNMGCLFCQNWSISKSRANNDGLYNISPEAIAQTAVKHHCRSVAFTYNEPVIFFEYALETAKECRRQGIKTVAVTAGYMNPEPRKEFYQLMDGVNVDLKAFTSDFYERNCQAQLAPVLDTIRYIKKETETWLEVTTLLIEGENDSEEELKRECDWLVENVGTTTPVHFSAFRPAWKFLDKKPTRLSTLLKAYKIAKEAGIKHVYTGNIPHRETSTTYCEQCGQPLIIRQEFRPGEICLDKECCPSCRTRLSGVLV